MSTLSEARLEHMRGPGFTMFTNVSNRFYEHLDSLPLPESIEFEPYDNVYMTPQLTSQAVGSAATGLYLATSKLRNQLVEQWRGDEKTTPDWFFARYGVTEEQQKAAKGMYYEYGFDDMDFTWYFAPYLAHAVTRQMEIEGHITDNERQGLVLGDWANVIGSGWFSSLMHELTIAKFGAYGTTGSMIGHYKTGLLDLMALHARDHNYSRIFTWHDPFVIEKVQEEDTEHITAKLAKKAADQLRSDMDKSQQSVATSEHGLTHGCPVFRFAGSLAASALVEDSHLRSLLAKNEIFVYPSEKYPDRIRFEQLYTAIDYSLMALAARIDAYDAAYGTPLVTVSNGQTTGIEHHHFEPTNVLCRPVDPGRPVTLN